MHRFGSSITASVLTLAAGLTVAGCKTTASKVKHDMDQPVRNASAWNWLELTDAQSTILQDDHPVFLPVDHPLAVRTQLWIDRIDQYWRTKHPTELAEVPKPRGRVQLSNTQNAFVPFADACYTVPVKFVGATGAQQYLAARVWTNTGKIKPYSRDATAPCDAKTVDAGSGPEALAKLRPFIKDFNAAGYPCQLSIDDSGAVVAGTGCVTSFDLKKYSGAPKLVLRVTGNTPVFYTALAKASTEMQYVSVIAHELGHFYRSHSTYFKNDYDYFYPLNRGEGSTKPARDATLEDTGKAALVSVQRLNAKSYYASVPGQQLRPDMYFMTAQIVANIHDEAETKTPNAPSCVQAYAFIHSPDYVQAIGSYPLTATTTQAQIAAYQSFEAQVLG